MRKYLLRYSPNLSGFRLAELESIATLLRINIKFDTAAAAADVHHCLNTTRLDDSDRDRSTLLLVEVETEADIRLIGKRSILIKSIWEYWAQSSTYEDLHAYLQTHSELYTQYQESASFKLRVDTVNRSMGNEDQLATINAFAYLDLRGPIRMKDPQEEFGVIEEHVQVFDARPRAQTLIRVSFGRKICDAQRDLIARFDLKKRDYIGNTSMESEVSLLMAIQALARPGAFIYDPFAGTGSMLHTCAHFGARVIGSDIDGRMMRGKQGKSVFTTADQYGTRHSILDCLVFDLAQDPLRAEGFLDAIVTDPPYGIRAGARRLGRSDKSKMLNEPYLMEDGTFSHQLADYVPPSRPWEMSEVVSHLLEVSHRLLKHGGRLVYWLPTVRDEYQQQDIPTRKGMRLVADSEQVFNKWARHLITMEKVAEEDEATDHDASKLNGNKPAHFGFRERYFSKFV